MKENREMLTQVAIGAAAAVITFVMMIGACWFIEMIERCAMTL